MIEAQRQLGKLLLKKSKEKGFLSSILEEANKERREKKQHIIVLNLNTREEKLEIASKPIGEATPEEYLWIGNADAAASPQWYFTSNKPDYLISQVIPNILDLFPEENNFYQKMQNVQQKYFSDLGEQKGMRKRYRYILDLHKLKITSQKLEDMKNESDGNVKEVLDKAVKALEDAVKDKTELNKSQMALWTLEIDGEKMVDEKVYQEQIIKDKFEEIYEDKKEALCSLCREQRVVTDETTKFDFKYYMTDKMGFSSQISGDFTKSFRLCEQCYQAVLAGENFIKKNARVRIGNFSAYLVPSAVYEPGELLVRKDSPLWNEFKMALTNVKELARKDIYLQRLKNFTDGIDGDNNYIFNLIFYEKSQASFKILKYIKDVPPARFRELADLSRELDLEIKDILGDNFNWKIDFNRIYYMIPLKTSQGNPAEHRKLLKLYENILQGKPVNEEFLIKQFVKAAKIHFYDQYNSYNINPGGNNLLAMVHSINLNNVFLVYLKRLNLLDLDIEGNSLAAEGNSSVAESSFLNTERGGMKKMKTEELMLDEGFKEYLDGFEFDEAKASLFLLGYMVGEVASKQEAVLNKLNFQGMALSKVKRLVSEIFEKLRQYEKLKYNKKVYSEMKKLFDGNEENWPLSSQDNIFYILSGYAYQVRKLHEGSQKKAKAKKEANDD